MSAPRSKRSTRPSEGLGSCRLCRSSGSWEGRFARCWERLEVSLLEAPRPIPGLLGGLVSSKEFELLSAVVILANAVYIAYASDLEIDQIGREDYTITNTWLWVEILLTAWYALELAMRGFVYRVHFFLSRDLSWNMFDTVLVLLSLQDIVMSVGSANPAFLRIMRIGRMLKLLRVIRLLRVFRELRLILNAILGCMKSVFWAMILIVNVSFIFGLCFLQATADHLREQGDGVDATTKVSLLKYWGNCRSSMYSLYAAALGGTDWDLMVSSLRPVGSEFVLLFLVYVGFFFCVVTNTLTSLFVEATMANAQRDQQEVIQAELEQRQVYVQQLRRFFLKFDGQNTGEVTLEDFLEHVDDPEMIWFASQLGIELVDAKQFFSVLSSGGRLKVNLEAFVIGCIRLKGTAKSMDLMDMKLTLEQEAADVRRSLTAMETRGRLEAVASAVGAASRAAPRAASKATRTGARHPRRGVGRRAVGLRAFSSSRGGRPPSECVPAAAPRRERSGDAQIVPNGRRRPEF
ncbi:unnamed protein product [Prorocentrum cordatum]|uniref:Ion transport domain-containing protein n=1 Tax=Prorocentrum cordatum TaxID=2364126 RepID=A0ABN9Y5D3_9DINO|nr:unnamed protein product [Polarella glacialis]